MQKNVCRYLVVLSEQIIINPHLHERVSNHRDQKYIGEVSFWPAEYRNRPPKVPIIFNFKNFGDFQKFLIRPEMHYLLFYAVKTALEPYNNLQICFQGGIYICLIK
jgi:hypothetical protein